MVLKQDASKENKSDIERFKRITTLFFVLLCTISLIFISTVTAQSRNTDPLSATKTSAKQLSHDFNSILVAELYHQLGDSKSGVSHYMKVAFYNDDPAIAERATEIASRSKQLQHGLKMAERWVELSPKSLQARQYMALLLLRNNQFKKSSEQLSHIQEIVEESESVDPASKMPLYSKSLKFIGAMLLIESHHKKALKVFDEYLINLRKKAAKKDDQDDYRAQQYLVRASLAEKANDYPATLKAINNYESLTTNHLAEVITMKLKALQELNQYDVAVAYLTPVIDNQKGTDSLQLELVRLLILNKQKSRASPYLKDLVAKHPDNNDLLKSLIALQIDQKELAKAEGNINILDKSIEFKNDAKYFIAELLEARGDLELALEGYKKVKSGSLFKSAKKKISRLTLILNKALRNKANHMKTNKKHTSPLFK